MMLKLGRIVLFWVSAFLLYSCANVPQDWRQRLGLVDKVDETEPQKTSEALKQPTQVYVIKSGDTLSKVAMLFNIDTATLLDLNPIINPRRLRVGSRVLIPATATATITKEKPYVPKKVITKPSPVIVSINNVKIKDGDRISTQKNRINVSLTSEKNTMLTLLVNRNINAAETVKYSNFKAPYNNPASRWKYTILLRAKNPVSFEIPLTLCQNELTFNSNGQSVSATVIRDKNINILKDISSQNIDMPNFKFEKTPSGAKYRQIEAYKVVKKGVLYWEYYNPNSFATQLEFNLFNRYTIKVQPIGENIYSVSNDAPPRHRSYLLEGFSSVQFELSAGSCNEISADAKIELSGVSLP